MAMFPNESRKTWMALTLLGCAAVLLLVCGVPQDRTYAPWARQIANVLTVVALLLVLSPGSLNRTLVQIHRDIASGRKARSTTLQKICFLLAVALIVVQTYQSWHAV